jgi:hypothetical protein
MLTLSEVKASWIKTTSNDLNTQITGWINTATIRIKSICRQPILQESVNLSFVGNDRQVRLAHVTTTLGSISGVQFRANPFNSWQSQTSIDVSAFEIEGVWYLYREGFFDSGNLWKVSTTAGWSINSIPLDIKTVCGEMIYQLFKESPYATDQRVLGLTQLQKSQGGPGGIVTTHTFQDMLPRWEMLLEPYTIVTA